MHLIPRVFDKNRQCEIAKENSLCKAPFLSLICRPRYHQTRQDQVSIPCYINGAFRWGNYKFLDALHALISVMLSEIETVERHRSLKKNAFKDRENYIFNYLAFGVVVI